MYPDDHDGNAQHGESASQLGENMRRGNPASESSAERIRIQLLPDDLIDKIAAGEA